MSASARPKSQFARRSRRSWTVDKSQCSRRLRFSLSNISRCFGSACSTIRCGSKCSAVSVHNPNRRKYCSYCAKAALVSAYDERIIRDAINRELERQGQVFFLYNRVMTIERARDRIVDLCPQARVEIGHGQMDSDELEAIMAQFVAGKIDVLVCTTIIESGLDIPNANTIIIDRADRFGLADLYQLRGRVGRAEHKAYAYLLLPRELMMVGAARKRINAIKQYSSLGAGFRVAMRDLEIRGAGSILGTAQSGHIMAVGFDLYCQLLKQAVAQIKGQKPRWRLEVDVRLDFVVTNEAEFVQQPRNGGVAREAVRGLESAEALAKERIPSFIPVIYVSDPALRIRAYRDIAEIT